MIMYEELTKKHKLIPEKLVPFGFIKEGEAWRYDTEILNGDFSLSVIVKKDGTLDTSATEKASGEEYVLYKTAASGAFLGEVRTAIREVLDQVVSSCYMAAAYRCRQTEMLLDHALETYGDSPEFLWTKFPDYCVLRRKDNDKWYAVIGVVQRGKVDGSDSQEMVEVADFRMETSEKERILSFEGFHPGWHMNKNTWFTVILDGSVDDGTVIECADRSCLLAGDKNSYEKIYEVVKSIPEGKVATYGQVARLAGNSKWSRVVGYALHVNPEPGIIPCHRVVNSKGEPSQAFAFGGENRQIELLEKEGVSFVDGHVDMEHFRWETD